MATTVTATEAEAAKVAAGGETRETDHRDAVVAPVATAGATPDIELETNSRLQLRQSNPIMISNTLRKSTIGLFPSSLVILRHQLQRVVH